MLKNMHTGNYTQTKLPVPHKYPPIVTRFDS